MRFPGGSIGELAVNGTVNDLAVAGARPLALSLSLILEEGLDADDAARRGRGDRRRGARPPGSRSSPATRRSSSAATPTAMYVCTTGVGRVDPRARLSPAALRAGRPRSSSPARSASTARRSCSPAASSTSTPTIESDTRSLWPAVDALLDAAGADAALPARRDPRRRGLGAQRARARVRRRDDRARGATCRCRPAVAGAAELLGHRPDVRRQRGQARRVRRARGAPTRRSPRCARCRAASRRPRSARCAPSRPGWCWSRPRSAASA